MHNVLFSVVYIKRGGGAKALNPCIYTHIHVYAPQLRFVSRDNDVDARQQQ